MSFWLIVYLFTADGQYMGKDIYEAANQEQCIEFASRVTKTLVNTRVRAQFECVSDEKYRDRSR